MHRRFKRSHTIKPHRVVSRRNKKRNGGMFTPKRAVMTIATASPEGVSPALVSKGSGMLAALMQKLHKPPSSATTQPLSDLPVPGGMDKLVSKTVHSKENEAFANVIFEDAARLRATSFRSLNVEECAQIMRRVVTELNQAIAMGSLRARAYLADMLLQGHAVGVAYNFDAAVDLVSQHDRMDPDCAGVLAQCHFHADELNDARRLAEASASAGSKYGQLALGLLEKKKRELEKAAVHFALAADQNYDEAQYKLAEMKYVAAVQDVPEALRLLTLAAVQGNKHAFYLIGCLYGINDDESEKKRWIDYYLDAGDITSPHLRHQREEDMKRFEYRI